MELRLERTEERLTRKTGLVLIDRFGKKVNLGNRIDRQFGRPGSNRGVGASEYVLTLTEMLIDGAMHLEDVRDFENDEAYKLMTGREHYPTSDALGDWLRRQGGENGEGEKKMMNVNAEVIKTLTKIGQRTTLDVDASVIEADKGDARYTYKQIRGYQPLLAASVEMGLFMNSRFQHGNENAQGDIKSFIDESVKLVPGMIKTVRIDSVGYNHFVFDYCFDNNLNFTITADHDMAVMEVVRKIPENAWERGKNEDGSDTNYEIAETVHTMNKCKRSFRLVVKRARRRQTDLLEGEYFYWIIATNFSREEKSTQEIIHFHEKRGEMERMIGELKNHYNLDHFPCGQFSANSLYFAIGVFAFNLVQLLKQHYFGDNWRTKTLRSLRYYWLHLPSRLVFHARYMVAKVATTVEWFKRLDQAYLKLVNAPAPSSS
ncbi:MAG: IS1380 family transposase [Caldisericaceae bacterium]